MAVKVNCPYCDLARLVVEEQFGTEITCAACGGRFIPEADDPPPRRAPRPRPREDDTDAPPPRWADYRDRDRDDRDDRDYRERDDLGRRMRYGRRPRRRRDPIRERLNAPATFLLVLTLIQAIIHVGIVGIFVLMAATDRGGGQGEEDERLVRALVALIVGAVLVTKDAIVLFGVAAMRQGRGHGRALFGTIVSLCPDVFWLITPILPLIPSIWCLVALNNSEVKAAFEENRRAVDD